MHEVDGLVPRLPQLIIPDPQLQTSLFICLHASLPVMDMLIHHLCVSSGGMFMGPSQMQFPVQAAAGYQAFPGMGTAMPPTTVMGAMMAQSGAAMMGPSPGMMVGMTVPNGFMGNAPASGVMGMAPRMMPAGMVPAQGMYAIQPGQQAQWNMAQVRTSPQGTGDRGLPRKKTHFLCCKVFYLFDGV